MVKKLLNGSVNAVTGLVVAQGRCRPRLRDVAKRLLLGAGLFAVTLLVGQLDGQARFAERQSLGSTAATPVMAASLLPFLHTNNLIPGKAARRSALSDIHIVGPSAVPEDEFCDWTPDIPGVSGPPYAGTIRWFIDGTLVSPVWDYNGYTGRSDFTLVLDVWDPNGQFLGEDQLFVNVGGAGSC